ncbi:alpha-1,2-mannosidase [Rubrobacter xylanophilus]|uniref:Alpha-1,2-mannosidase n=1 Tax=Rubrobacter xylanophilus TaxID=49319 RepID=A0A510HIW1_9ACTN|nr:GH92 family glycosyl hydrolase [Rubrobacter xylanophilus]BBL79922.1 alpha-1,2-mannosidase [Rubrobacter xylanophilus]
MGIRTASCAALLCTILAVLAPAGGVFAREAGEEGFGEPASYVNPFIGTQRDGNTFPGPVVPFGMVQLSPDTGHYAGYSYDDPQIRGFSHTHLSGVGCATHGDVPFMPTTGEVRETAPGEYGSGFDHASERAEPGYYAVTLDRYGVRAELTATERTGWHRYAFPEGRGGNVLINVGESLSAEFDAGVWISGDDTVEGFVTSGNFCASDNRYTVYFSARFDRPFERFGTWNGGTITGGSRRAEGPDAGAYVSFEGRGSREVVARVGISYVSVEGARRNLEAEASGRSFDEVRERAWEAWNRELSRVEISGAGPDQRAVFYTALYHALLHPNIFSDADGRYMGWDGRVHRTGDGAQYANFSLWDTYRPQHQLLALLVPERAKDMLGSLLDIEREAGWLPKWALNNAETNVMTGDPVTPVLVDGHLKGLLEGREREAYRTLYKNATRRPPEDSRFAGRAGARDYARLGYVPYDPSRPGKPGDNDYHHGASATLEYALSDCAMALMARDLGYREDYGFFLERAQSYRNLWDRSTGFFRPRLPDGSFLAPYDPKGNQGFHEGTAHQYHWLVPQNFPDLIRLSGGREETSRRLDYFFAYQELLRDPEGTARNVWVSGPYDYYGADRYNPNNEPDLHSPYTYLWTGEPHKTADVVRAQRTLFTNGPDGMTGNDDLGTMSAWYIFSSIGLYPVMGGADYYALTSPAYERVEIHLHPGFYDAPSLVIEAPGASQENRYVRGVRLNGKPHRSSWIQHERIREGARLGFELGPSPAGWATRPSEAPPAACGAKKPTTRSLYLNASPSETTLPQGGQTRLEVFPTVTATAEGRVEGRIDISAPEGWRVEPGRLRFSLHSGGTPVQKEYPFLITIPEGIPAGEYEVGLSARAGPLSDTSSLTVRVVEARCAAEDRGFCAADLRHSLNSDGVSTDANPGDGDFDGLGFSYPAEELPVPGPFESGGVLYWFTETSDGAPNNIEARGQTVPLVPERYAAAHILGAAHHGAVETAATVTYADGSTERLQLSLSDWAQETPQFGEEVAVRTTHRHQEGAGDVGPPVAIFAFSLELDPSREVRFLTLPAEVRLHLFAITLRRSD